MTILSNRNIVDISETTLSAGQRAMKITTSEGSVVVPVGIGSFVAGGNIYVEAQKRVVDDTSTAVTLNVVEANVRYEYTQPLTSLNIFATQDTGLESDIVFTAGTGFILADLPVGINTLGPLLAGEEAFTTGIKYVINFRYNEAVAFKYNR